jgi:hypothetical protein
VVLGKGKAYEGEAIATEPGNPPSPSVRTPFSPPHFPSRPLSEVSHFLNFGSVPIEVSPPSLGLEGEILVTPICNTLFPPVCKNNWTGQELWQTHKCEYVM